MNAVAIHAPLTPKADTAPHVVKLKVFWKTTKKWKAADIADFRQSVPRIAERLRQEQYWNKDGDIRSNKFTCEDFAIRVLCEYASANGLPVKLTTGVRTYRNMELYDAGGHDRYASNKYGFSEMVMLTFGARDMQSNENTKPIASEPELLPGDILAQAKDLRGQTLSASQSNVAHHIQMVVQISANTINVYQGNSDSSIQWPMRWVNKIVLRNPADPKEGAYGGKKVEKGIFTKNGKTWDYKNIDTGKKQKDFLSLFLFYRWKFDAFNK